MTSSWGGVLVKMMVDGNSLTKATQLFIYFRKKGKHVDFLVMAA